MSNFCITEHINSCFVAPGFQTPLCTQFNATWLSHQSWLPLWLRGIWHAIGPRVFVRVCAHAWDSKGNESRCHCWASASRECRDAEGKVTCLSVCLSVRKDLFQTAGVDFHRACCVHCMLSEGIMPQTTSQKCWRWAKPSLSCSQWSACLETEGVVVVVVVVFLSLSFSLRKYLTTYKSWLMAEAKYDAWWIVKKFAWTA